MVATAEQMMVVKGTVGEIETITDSQTFSLTNETVDGMPEDVIKPNKYIVVGKKLQEGEKVEINIEVLRPLKSHPFLKIMSITRVNN